MDDSQITQPLQKAVTSLGLTAGSGVMAYAEKAVSFYPDNAIGWVGLGVGCIAFLYNFAMFSEFMWKKWFRPVLRHVGLIRPGSFFFETDRFQ